LVFFFSQDFFFFFSFLACLERDPQRFPRGEVPFAFPPFPLWDSSRSPAKAPRELVVALLFQSFSLCCFCGLSFFLMSEIEPLTHILAPFFFPLRHLNFFYRKELTAIPGISHSCPMVFYFFSLPFGHIDGVPFFFFSVRYVPPLNCSKYVDNECLGRFCLVSLFLPYSVRPSLPMPPTFLFSTPFFLVSWLPKLARGGQ